MIKILYIDSIGPFGGASRSLIENLNVLKNEDLNLKFIITKGSSVSFYKNFSDDYICSKGYFKFDNTAYSRYKGVRWLILIREFFYLPHTFLALFLAKKKFRNIDIIHINEIHSLFFGIFAKFIFKAKLVVHVRSVQNTNASSIRTKFINLLLERYVDLIICIDNNVKKSLLINKNIIVIHNSFSVAKSNSYQPTYSKNNQSINLGFLGNIHKSKGVFDILDAAIILNSKNVDFKIHICGGKASSRSFILNKFLYILNINQEVESMFKDLIFSNNLSERFVFWGHQNQLSPFFEEIDLILFPSHFDAPGRPIFEAAFYKIPSIAAITDSESDTFINFDSGISILPKKPELLAKAILYFFENRSEIDRMGNNAFKLAQINFDPVVNSKLLMTSYLNLIE
jgi:glycosyltransferase involved in cell wall biosynthesis